MMKRFLIAGGKYHIGGGTMGRINAKVAGCCRYLEEFCYETTFHGMIHLVVPKRHWLERVFWIVVLIVSVVSSCWIVTESWHRYITNPVVISMVKEYRTWNVTLPTTTLCYVDKLDVKKAAIFIKSQWNISAGDEKYEYYLSLVSAVTNSGIKTLAPFEQFKNDVSLTGIDLVNITFSTVFEHTGIFEVMMVGRDIAWTLTEMGLCFSVMWPNSIAHPIFAQMFPTMKNPQLNAVPFCKSTKNACIGSVMDFPRPYNTYTHSPMEIPDAQTKFVEGLVQERLRVSLEEEQLDSSPAIRNLWLSQRGCRFPDENIYGHAPVYSINFCRMQCRRNLIMKFCGCVPHFYSRLPSEKICDVKGLACAAGHVGKIFENWKSMGCKCLPTCEEIVYNIDKIYRNSYYSSSLNWNVINFAKSHYRRDVIFEFSDLLVSFGGTAALFLGCSLMTGVELVYFFTLRLTRLIGRKTVHLRQTFRNRRESFWNRVNAKL